MRQRTEASPFAAAFFTLVESLGIVSHATEAEEPKPPAAVSR